MESKIKRIQRIQLHIFTNKMKVIITTSDTFKTVPDIIIHANTFTTDALSFVSFAVGRL